MEDPWTPLSLVRRQTEPCSVRPEGLPQAIGEGDPPPLARLRPVAVPPARDPDEAVLEVHILPPGPERL